MDSEMMAAVYQACLDAAVAMGSDIKGLSWYGKWWTV